MWIKSDIRLMFIQSFRQNKPAPESPLSIFILSKRSRIYHDPGQRCGRRRYGDNKWRAGAMWHRWRRRLFRLWGRLQVWLADVDRRGRGDWSELVEYGLGGKNEVEEEGGEDLRSDCAKGLKGERNSFLPDLAGTIRQALKGWKWWILRTCLSHFQPPQHSPLFPTSSFLFCAPQPDSAKRMRNVKYPPQGFDVMSYSGSFLWTSSYWSFCTVKDSKVRLSDGRGRPPSSDRHYYILESFLKSDAKVLSYTVTLIYTIRQQRFQIQYSNWNKPRSVRNRKW